MSGELKTFLDINRDGLLGFSWVISFVGGILVGLGLMRDQMIKDYNLVPKADKKASD